MKAYRENLAYIHDVGFGSFVERAAPTLLDILQGVGINDGLVVDLGCGSGSWGRHLVDGGYSVLGIDISRDMVAICAETWCLNPFVMPFYSLLDDSCKYLMNLQLSPIPRYPSVEVRLFGLRKRVSGASGSLKKHLGSLVEGIHRSADARTESRCHG